MSFLTRCSISAILVSATLTGCAGHGQADESSTAPTAVSQHQPADPAPITTPRQGIYRAALRLQHHARDGQVIARITIPRLDLRAWAVRQGAEQSHLDQGPSHYGYSWMPGLGGTTAIAGHRVTPVGGRPYGPFRYINRLKRGDRIRLTTQYATFDYRVASHQIVKASATGIVRLYGHEVLLLSACHPPGSAEYRYIVYARLVKETPA